MRDKVQSTNKFLARAEGLVRTLNSSKWQPHIASYGSLGVPAYWERKKSKKSDDAPLLRDFEYVAHGTQLRGASECGGSTAAQRAAFEAAFAAFVARHNAIVAGEASVRFVHMSIGWPSSVQNTMKAIVSAVLLGMVLQRAVVLSWPRQLDPESLHYYKLSFDDLFEPPPFNWTYDVEKFDAPRFDRYNTHAYGLEEFVKQEPLFRLFCADIVHDETPWVALPYDYAFVGQLLWHSPYTHDIVAQWLPRDDMFGPVARKLFRPNARMWARIDAFRTLHFAAPAATRVVGVLLPNTDRGAVVRMLDSVAKDAAGAGAAEQRLLYFAVATSDAAMRTALQLWGNRPNFLYYPHRNFSMRGDEGTLLDLFLLNFCDTLYAPAAFYDIVGALFSRRPRLVNTAPNNNGPPLPDAVCHPCVSFGSVERTACFNKSMDWPQGPFKCGREYSAM